ncbi:hypothetical protein L5G32_03350 [Gordonia sp. HY002]|uniref:HD domain-containing protein n=1 Tax=Gordonia zhenghanii TaxID=2911516 RepID=UPI001EF06F7A|nr:hypothetical protein [Gordonia zhenghanii]MCF8569303.1 hypothetical protein [Gordonia zhenghanii]MCF8606685.1 hypothetical protein [Gordonia zhenghanii]
MDVEIPEAIEADLTARWDEPHRRHHNRRHLDEVLAALQLLHDEGLSFGSGPSSSPRGSTMRSTRRAVRTTNVTPPTSPDDRNGIALSDADLSVLGSDPARYDEYAADVRTEFHLVPDEVFRPGRRTILAEFVAADILFRSPQARQRWEAAARENLAREIDALA